MSIKFDEMNNSELKEYCDSLDLEVIAKNPAKPNKTELMAAINKFKSEQDITHADKIEDVSKQKETPKKSKSQLLKLDLFRKERVIIHDKQEAQTKDEVISVSWGNRLVGSQIDFVDLSGDPQYVRVGALNNLANATTVLHVPRKDGGDDMMRKKRFVIEYVEPLTEEELKELATKQKMRNSKYA